MIGESVEPRLEKRLEFVDPTCDLDKRLRLELVDPLSSLAPLRDQVGFLEHLQMLRNRCERHVEGCGELARDLFPIFEENENRPPARVGNCVEHVILLQRSHRLLDDRRIVSTQFVEPAHPVRQRLSAELRLQPIEEGMKAGQHA